MRKIIYILICVVVPQILFASGNESRKDSIDGNKIFGVDIIHEVRITFLQHNPWDSLFLMKKERDSLERKRYMQGNVKVDGEKYYSCGIRIKGESSFDFYPGLKKSLKINFGKFIKKQKLDGLKTINLNNAFRDPSFIREKLYLDFMHREGLPVPRCTFAKVYVNKEYIGLYVLTEEINKGFLKRNFQNKKGAFFKGEPKASLEYIGENIADYQKSYRSKNEDVNGFSELIELIKAINGISDEKGDELERIFNIEDCLKVFAITNLFMNVDAYNMLYRHNYYLYKNTSTNKFEWIPYDGNYAFCAFSPVFDLKEAHDLSIFYVNKKKVRPLMNFLFKNEKYRKYYIDYLKYLLEEKFTYLTLCDEIDDLIIKVRSSVYYDKNKMYSNSDFENSTQLTLGDEFDAGGFIPGLKPFIKKRMSAVRKEVYKIESVEK